MIGMTNNYHPSMDLVESLMKSIKVVGEPTNTRNKRERVDGYLLEKDFTRIEGHRGHQRVR